METIRKPIGAGNERIISKDDTLFPAKCILAQALCMERRPALLQRNGAPLERQRKTAFIVVNSAEIAMM
jgi:hypothetical protein